MDNFSLKKQNKKSNEDKYENAKAKGWAGWSSMSQPLSTALVFPVAGLLTQGPSSNIDTHSFLSLPLKRDTGNGDLVFQLLYLRLAPGSQMHMQYAMGMGKGVRLKAPPLFNFGGNLMWICHLSIP